MENNLLTKLREKMKRLEREDILSPDEESSRLPLLAQRHAEPSIKLRSHQIVQTKAQRSDADLNRVKEQNYIMTMKISKLLTEKNELEIKNNELFEENKKLCKEKNEISEDFEEKLRRKITSEKEDEIQKIIKENETLSTKIKKDAMEKLELLHKINELKEELHRKTLVLENFTIEKEQMKRKIEKLKRVCAEVLRRERPEDPGKDTVLEE
ncbi:uncharacterized protein MCAP_0864-like [Erythrolamprus reginae]|uniref:uncharacterized protein MCAP_0864-like n=1 Tax=Erythrolamprus reginae TaxID=121349 RepID=UPI00396CE597